MLEKDWVKKALRIVDDDLAIGIPARQLKVCIFLEIGNRVAVELRAYSAFSLVLCGCVDDSQVLDFRRGATVFEVGRV